MTFSFWPVVRLVLLVLLLALPTCYWIHSSESIRDSYQVPVTQPQSTAAPATSPEPAKPSPDSAKASAECAKLSPEVPKRMTEQNKQMIDWGVLLLGGLVALVTTTKVHKITYCEWWYLILVPAISFIFGSVWVGVLFQRRATYLEVHQLADTSESLLRYLWLQSTAFTYSLLPLALFAVLFLTAIILGRVNPCAPP